MIIYKYIFLINSALVSKRDIFQNKEDTHTHTHTIQKHAIYTHTFVLVYPTLSGPNVPTRLVKPENFDIV